MVLKTDLYESFVMLGGICVRKSSFCKGHLAPIEIAEAIALVAAEN